MLLVLGFHNELYPTSHTIDCALVALHHHPALTNLAPTTKTLFFALTAVLGAYLLLRGASSLTFRVQSAPAAFTSTSMTPASAQGWHARARPHPNATGLTASRDALAFVVLLHAPADPDSFTMALLRPDTAVDARGRVLQLEPRDAAALVALAEQTSRLPDTGSFMNAWRVAHPRTSQKIDRLFASVDGGGFRETSVQGWDIERTQLKTAVGDYQELPPVLYEFFRYIQEAREGFERGQEENKDVIGQIKALVPN